MFLKCRPSCILGSTWAIFELTYGQLGTNFRQLELNLGSLGADLELTWAKLGPTSANWRPFGANLNQLGASLGQLGFNLGELGANFGHPQHFASDFASDLESEKPFFPRQHVKTVMLIIFLVPIAAPAPSHHCIFGGTNTLYSIEFVAHLMNL